MRETFEKNSRILLLAVLLVSVVTNPVQDGRFGHEYLLGMNQRFFRRTQHWHNPAAEAYAVPNYLGLVSQLNRGGVMIVKASAYSYNWERILPNVKQAAKISKDNQQLNQENIILPQD